MATLVLLYLLSLAYRSVSAQGLKPVDIQDFAKQAVDDYFAEDYKNAIRKFEHALIHYRMLKSFDTVCGVRCNSPNISKEIGMDFTGFDELYAYGNLIAQANCMKICKEEHPLAKTKILRPREDYVRDIEKRMPYNYLQFAYYQMGDTNKASQAAFTYLQGNPEDEQMKENIAYYKALGIEKKFFVDLERQKYQELFQEGVKQYESENYAGAIENMEEMLVEYVGVMDECKASCHVEKEPETFHSLPIAVAFRYQPVIECCQKCEEKTRPVVDGHFVNNFIPRTYVYLQFAYFQLKNYEKAVSAAASALLLDPDDEITVGNMEYYKENAEELGVNSDLNFMPRPEAVKFHLERIRETKLLDLMEKVADYEDEEEIEDDEEEGSLKDLVQAISQQVMMQVGQNLRGDTG